MPATDTDWKSCLYVFLNGKTGKLHFTSISELWMPPPPPRMKLFGNQQLECLQGHMFFSRQKHIYILDPPSHHKKGSLPHNFQSFSNFSGYLEALGIWMYLFEEYHIIFCALCRSGYFYSLSHSITLTKVSFPYKNCGFGHIPEVDRLLGKEDTPSH